jgi:ketosteroid isomerase-like protein
LTNDEIRMAIDKANRKFEEGFLKSDASITASGFSDNAIVFPPDDGTMQGKKAIEDFWRTVMASGVKEVSLNTVEVSVSGDFAVERGIGVLKIRSPSGTPSEQNIKYVVVWKRTAEGWKNMWDIWNASP